jgi:DNA repair exonuclease SbcCD ATPase subunit
LNKCSVRSRLEQKLTQKDAYIETAQTAVAEIKGQAQKQIDSLTARIAQLEQKLTQKDAHIETAQTAVTEIKQQAQKQVDSLTARIAQLEQKLQEQTLVGTETQQNFAEVAESKEQIQKQVDSLTSRLTQLQTSLEQESNAKAVAQQKLIEEAQARLKAEQKAQIEADKADQAEQELKTQKELASASVIDESESRMMQTSHEPRPVLHSDSEGGATSHGYTCDCCGQNTFTLDQLEKIDSGHLFCPDCLAALRR